ncbi:hypothetical protein [Xanthomonas theicola]|uniref:Uncharacterized protein n=1 Tax=Xanthomonas theicola TaxID=56464 RepID=A0A2S6ZH01_9XANT|nr:hypothetical protein [Xanthomonas theicola]PPT91429.1 hypothetical protein XthCFBP4691_07835 [Xanthomonas theicola]QNH27233.1 hypothetical protein G4Q83_22220 [Xanthomonas theicola]
MSEPYEIDHTGQLDVLEQHVIRALDNGVALPYRYQGLHGESLCNLIVAQDGDEAAVVLFSERADNPGAPITNWFEHIATEVRAKFLPHIAPGAIRWFEHYPAGDTRADSIDRVTLQWHAIDRQYHSAAWSRVRGCREDGIPEATVAS